MARGKQDKTLRLLEAITEFATPEHPRTVRSIYYHLVTTGLLESSKASYDRVKMITGKSRKDGSMPYASIVDNGRAAERRSSWKDLADRAESARFVHLDPWPSQPDRVYLIIEKDAAKHLIRPICDEYDVTLFPLRGDSSLSFLHAIAGEIKDVMMQGNVYVGYWGDFDPGGISIGRAAERGIMDILCKDFSVTFDGAFAGALNWTRLGINAEDMREYNLLPIPGKEKDTKLPAFQKEFGVSHGAEIDALPEEVIVQRTRDFIESHINREIWDNTKIVHEVLESQWTQSLYSIQ